MTGAGVENRRTGTKRQTGVVDAQNAQVKRTMALPANAASVRAALDGLRNTVSLLSHSAVAVGRR